MARLILVAMAAGVAIAITRLVRRYRRELEAARARVAAVKRPVIDTPWGRLEYAEEGSGERPWASSNRTARSCWTCGT